MLGRDLEMSCAKLQTCIVLYCIVLYCIVLYCIVLYCIVLYCIVLYCIVLYCIVLLSANRLLSVFCVYMIYLRGPGVPGDYNIYLDHLQIDCLKHR